MTESTPPDDGRAEIAIVSIACLLGALAWPFIYPVLNLLMTFLSLGEGPLQAFIEFGSLYGQSDGAPGFFKGMESASRDLSPQIPALANLSYLETLKIYAIPSAVTYTIEFIFFVLVCAMCLFSRLLPADSLSRWVQYAAIALSLLPLLALIFLIIGTFLTTLLLAWHTGPWVFAKNVLLSPVILARLTFIHVGTLLLAFGFVPVGLSLAGRGSVARSFLLNFFRTATDHLAI